ncbi:catechol 2,3-dioxygenase-like lactoylglutathione lyase family enzyme [Paenibacillus shirakamiensis]|uniref:Catechol 2,3-dioxygenase-like lactoylglutathione lyase family enzyme n=1 Tax=Paenibacillus shirakamiensis TaxID=1265935 RepID=A0ABS4JJ94_9BACL|nr:VOC family protein [Paenibacillus shirakamiensis]MBP2000684.1 catechol 2,3-dioxygenase-like lactoylglutathione lyase family enzyme [Paenibacillus shirakamiensis]
MFHSVGTMLKGISHVQLPVKNVEESVVWYTTYLGLELKANFEAFAVLKFGEGPDLFLWETQDTREMTIHVDGEYLPVMGLETDDMEAFTAKLENSGATIELMPIEKNAEMRFVKFSDLSGNLFVVHQVIR